MPELEPFAALVATLPRGPGSVRVEEGPITRIVIDAPLRRNAMTPHMMVDFAHATRAAAGASVVLIRGEGDAFCSGGDLECVASALVKPGVGAQLRSMMAGAVRRLEESGAVIVAAVTGPALGGGAELLAACDLVFANPKARIGWVHARLGVSPGFGGSQRLLRRVGARRALRLLTEARLLSAEAALAAGLVDEIVEDPWHAAEAWAQAALELPFAALQGAVRLCRTLPEGSEDAERTLFTQLWGGPAHLDALQRLGHRP